MANKYKKGDIVVYDNGERAFIAKVKGKSFLDGCYNFDAGEQYIHMPEVNIKPANATQKKKYEKANTEIVDL